MDIETANGAKNKEPEYEVSLVPCKIRFNGSTTEFQAHFMDDQEDLRKTNDNLVTSIRGRKIIGKKLKFFEDSKIVLADVVESTDDDSSNNAACKTKSYQETAVVTQLVNYEREGNESRLEEEMHKFGEYLELVRMIHN
ncbi:LAMI_0G07470g1_1 [Lachancea mirantina]|uniref:LAMI_0G07470g1_1 n=1 Tax=Lachancea mirantina TaxID=1230905 RepID=A0A1G4K9M3_9SACH|nr:LAMI_0G07470g1_1 [Lachancea mirantina]